MDREPGELQSTGVAKSQTRLSNWAGTGQFCRNLVEYSSKCLRGVRKLEYWSATSNSHGLRVAPEALPGYLAKQTSKNRDIQVSEVESIQYFHVQFIVLGDISRISAPVTNTTFKFTLEMAGMGRRAREFYRMKRPTTSQGALAAHYHNMNLESWGRSITKRSVITSAVLIVFACPSPPLAGFTVLWRWYKHTNKSLFMYLLWGAYGSLNNNIW